MGKQYPTLDQERKLLRAGYTHIAGLDEAGRGAWAGPVAAAAVILPLDKPSLSEQLREVCDSKQCTAHQRDALYTLVCQVAISWVVSLVPARTIDQVGIVPATRQAMRNAVAQLSPAPEALLIDALRLPSVPLPQRAVKRGDLQCLTIAAASILAKVTRDRAMVDVEAEYPGYGFASHKGYGTRQHQDALRQLGPLDIHRWYFAPVANVARTLGLASQRLERYLRSQTLQSKEPGDLSAHDHSVR
jgi:ribonuclease HII